CPPTSSTGCSGQSRLISLTTCPEAVMICVEALGWCPYTTTAASTGASCSTVSATSFADSSSASASMTSTDSPLAPADDAISPAQTGVSTAANEPASDW